MSLFRKAFIKDYKNVNDAKVRTRYGMVASISGIIINIILFASKLVVGILSHSVTIVADAMNNFSDIGSATIGVVGFKLSSKPADEEHPYGHARIEQIAGLIVAIFVFAVGILLAKEAITKIITPVTIIIEIYTYVILAIGIFLKIIQMTMNYSFAKAISSPTLKAVGDDSRNDILATSVVLISTLVIKFTGVNIDGYAALLVSLFIIISCIGLFKETINPLIGIKPDKAFVDMLKDEFLSYENIIGVHDLIIHKYGATNHFVTVHLEVPAENDFLEMHSLIDTIESEVAKKHKLHLSIHIDPVVTKDPRVDELKKRCQNVVSAFEGVSFHDFRVVFGSHINIILDLVIPFGKKGLYKTVVTALNKEFENEEITHYIKAQKDRVYV